MKKLPTLYKLSTKGVHQHWDIATEKNVIVTRWGQIGGKTQETRDEVKEGKNSGRSNATTAVEQAQAEAQSRWEHKLKKGYVKSLDEAKAGDVDDVIAGGIFPMLAHTFEKQGHKLVYPCFCQPKFDGHRCIAIIDGNGVCTLWTRSRKPITSMGHIIKELERMELRGVILDGELYNHDYKDKFEELTSFIRDSSAKPGADVVQYHVYDVVLALPQDLRLKFLDELSMASPIIRVLTFKVSDEEELMNRFELFLSMGYEGAMARNIAGLYKQNGRSYDLFKIKEFSDAEFKCVAIEEGRGKLAGHAIFVCETGEGAKFKAKLMGDTADLKKYWDKPSLAIGRQLTVKYQGITNKAGVPRFPVAVRFRDEV